MREIPILFAYTQTTFPRKPLSRRTFSRRRRESSPLSTYVRIAIDIRKLEAAATVVERLDR